MWCNINIFVSFFSGKAYLDDGEREMLQRRRRLTWRLAVWGRHSDTPMQRTRTPYKKCSNQRVEVLFNQNSLQGEVNKQSKNHISTPQFTIKSTQNAAMRQDRPLVSPAGRHSHPGLVLTQLRTQRAGIAQWVNFEFWRASKCHVFLLHT